MVIMVAVASSAVSEDTISLNNEDKVYSGETVVILTFEETYSLVIPASLPISYAAESTDMAISVSYMLLGTGRVLKITPEASSGQLTAPGVTKTLPYQLQLNGTAFNGLTFSRPSSETVKVLISKDDWYAAPAGTYTGLITFNVSIANAQ